MLLLGVNKKLEFLHVPYQGGGGGGQPPNPLKKIFLTRCKKYSACPEKSSFFLFCSLKGLRGGGVRAYGTFPKKVDFYFLRPSQIVQKK